MRLRAGVARLRAGGKLVAVWVADAAGDRVGARFSALVDGVAVHLQ